MSRVQIEITLGTIFILASSILFVWYGLNEEKRMAEFELARQARSIEQGAALFEQLCSRCHGTQGLGIPGLCPPLNDRYFFDQRLEEIEWSGTLEDYIVATASSGRLTSTRPDVFPGQGTPSMPSFSTQFGGPLREDQIRNIAAFVLNWESTAESVEVPQVPTGPVAGTDITKELPEGDPVAGAALAEKLACTACHIAAPTGPAWLTTETEAGVGTRAATRFTQADYTGSAQNAAQYLFESIVLPNLYIVPGFQEGLMPNNYGTSLTDQELADLIAYLLSLE